MSKPNFEAMKEVLRWVVLFIVSWFISELLRQSTVVPETYFVKVLLFTFQIPLRTAFVFSLTMFGRYIDKFLHENKKAVSKDENGKPPGGLLWF